MSLTVGLHLYNLCCIEETMRGFLFYTDYIREQVNSNMDARPLNSNIISRHVYVVSISLIHQGVGFILN